MTGIQAKTIEHVKTLRALAEAGKTRAEAGEAIGLTPSQVGLIARTHSIPFQHAASLNKAPPDARAHRMAAMYRAGSTLEQIGQLYMVTRERVRQILTKHFGIRRDDGGMHMLAAKKLERKAIQKEARSLSKYGCTAAEFDEIVAVGLQMREGGSSYYCTPIGAFLSQHSNARKRGIEWHLNLKEWWSVWQDSGKWELRGRGRYVMCRHGDVGPYAVGNVFVGTAAENSTTRKGNKRELPTGVIPNRCGNFVAKRCISGKQTHLGTYPTPEAAHAAYLAAEPSYMRAAS